MAFGFLFSASFRLPGNDCCISFFVPRLRNRTSSLYIQAIESRLSEARLTRNTTSGVGHVE